MSVAFLEILEKSVGSRSKAANMLGISYPKYSALMSGKYEVTHDIAEKAMTLCKDAMCQLNDKFAVAESELMEDKETKNGCGE